jgi:hypothetical protein
MTPRWIRGTESGKAERDAPFHERPEWKHRLNKRCRALWRVLDRGVRHVEEEVAHVHDYGIAIGHVCHLVPPICEPVDGPGLGGSGLEPLLEFCPPRRRAKLAHHGFAARVFGSGQMWTKGFEVFGEGGGQRRYGKVGHRGLVSEHWALVRVGFVAFWEAGVGVRRPRLTDHPGALFHGDQSRAGMARKKTYRKTRYVGE